MLIPRPAGARGATRLDWLDSRHTFSFGEYHDPAHVAFGPLRVINDDVIAPGAGFPPHPHRDMEILSWLLDGALAHRDSLGNGSTIRPGEAQLMHAGTGITHSEYNPSRTDAAHLLQIWIIPARRDLVPGYGQRALDPAALDGRLALLATPPGGGGAVEIHQDARVLVGRFADGQRARHALASGRGAWVHVARGACQVNGTVAAAGDGFAVVGEAAVEIAQAHDAEVLVFEVTP